MATPSQNRRSSGRCRKLSTELAKRTDRLKLDTMPAMIRYGRARLVEEEPPAMTTGITGTMHGERPVIRPPRKATTSSSPTGVARLQATLHRRSSILPSHDEAIGSHRAIVVGLLARSQTVLR